MLHREGLLFPGVLINLIKICIYDQEGKASKDVSTYVHTFTPNFVPLVQG